MELRLMSHDIAPRAQPRHRWEAHATFSTTTKPLQTLHKLNMTGRDQRLARPLLTRLMLLTRLSADGQQTNKTKRNHMKVTRTNLGNGLKRETIRYKSGSGKSTSYKDGLIFRNVKSVSKWNKK